MANAHPSFSSGRQRALACACACIGVASSTACTTSTTASSPTDGQVPDDAAVCIEHPNGSGNGDLCVERSGGVLRVEGFGLDPSSAVVFTGAAGDTLRDVAGLDGAISIEIGGAVATPPFEVDATWDTGTPAAFTTGDDNS